MLQETFIRLLQNYTAKENTINELWNEIVQNYTSPTRHYHTLQHLENLLLQLTDIKDLIQNWHTILFTLYYHDIIYKASASDNEEKSAALATKRMQQLGVNDEAILCCQKQILATKTHLKATDSDTNYFTDADLSILGQNWEIYAQYYKNVRKEYAIYPDIVYNIGRRKVLSHFLSMERIFKTDFFFHHFEAQAKLNLQREIALL